MQALTWYPCCSAIAKQPTGVRWHREAGLRPALAAVFVLELGENRYYGMTWNSLPEHCNKTAIIREICCESF
jgi:hypothetical protein